MRYRIVGTGSSGNATIIEDKLMIDCGLSYKALEPFLKKVEVILLTHKHCDHFNRAAVLRIKRKYPNIKFYCSKVFADSCPTLDFNVAELGAWTQVQKGLQICPIKLYHDSPNVGWRVKLGNKKLIYATDTATMEGIRAKDYDLYLIEANYDADTLNERIARKRNTGEFIYEYKLASRHLSKQEAEEWIKENANKNSEVKYIHEHMED